MSASGAGRRRLLALALCAATAGVYAETGGFDFVHGDDQAYVAENEVVRRGLTLRGLRWAATSLDFANWHPLTWVSHMIDVQLFGVAPGAHHLVNAGLHAANAGLLFWLLERLSGSPWRSALVAALFALHPLHVESVAWVAERKDLLAGLFFLLTVGAYLRRLRRPGTRRGRWVAACFALGLMAKPTLVTLPLVLLLLDFWPLGRARPGGGARAQLAAAWPLIVEKLPLLALSALSSAVTLLAQSRFGAVTSLGAAPLGLRLANALVAYGAYLGKAVWPAGLASFYPFPQAGLPAWRVLAAGLLLAALTAAALRARRRLPFLAVGWLWFLGMLVPVIGLVQVGAQALADRYTYLPLTGVFVAAVWSVPAGWLRPGARRAAVGALALCALGVLAAQTRAQARLWRDGITLLRATAAATADDWLTRWRLGQALAEQGSWDEALAQMRESLRIRPEGRHAYDIGQFLRSHGRYGSAAEFLRQAVTLVPRYPLAHFMLGLVLARLGELGDAATHFGEAARQDPGFAEAHYELGIALAQLGDLEGAVRSLSRQVVLQSAFAAQAHYNLGVVLEELGRGAEAEAHFREAGRHP